MISRRLSSKALAVVATASLVASSGAGIAAAQDAPSLSSTSSMSSTSSTGGSSEGNLESCVATIAGIGALAAISAIAAPVVQPILADLNKQFGAAAHSLSRELGIGGLGVKIDNPFAEYFNFGNALAEAGPSADALIPAAATIGGIAVLFTPGICGPNSIASELSSNGGGSSFDPIEDDPDDDFSGDDPDEPGNPGDEPGEPGDPGDEPEEPGTSTRVVTKRVEAKVGLECTAEPNTGGTLIITYRDINSNGVVDEGDEEISREFIQDGSHAEFNRAMDEVRGINAVDFDPQVRANMLLGVVAGYPGMFVSPNAGSPAPDYYHADQVDENGWPLPGANPCFSFESGINS